MTTPEPTFQIFFLVPTFQSSEKSAQSILIFSEFSEPTFQKISFFAKSAQSIWSKETPPPLGGFLFTMFPDQEPCVRDCTTRCDRRYWADFSENLLVTFLSRLFRKCTWYIIISFNRQKKFENFKSLHTIILTVVNDDSRADFSENVLDTL